MLEPTLPIVPYGRGPGYERGHPAGPGDPMIALTALWDMTGMPVAALPVTWQAGISLVAPRGREARADPGGDRPPGARAGRPGVVSGVYGCVAVGYDAVTGFGAALKSKCTSVSSSDTCHSRRAVSGSRAALVGLTRVGWPRIS